MEDPKDEEDREHQEVQEEEFTVWHGLLLAESAAIMIGLVSPLTPSKTGSDRGIAHYFSPNRVICRRCSSLSFR
jgi:hypothetical protein